MNKQASALIVAAPGRLRDSLRVMLSAKGEITRNQLADDGKAALLELAKSRPSFVLLDANLPGGEAWRVLDELKQRWPQTRCVVWTHTPTQARRATAAGADSVLGARFSSESLSDAITQATTEKPQRMEWHWPREP